VKHTFKAALQIKLRGFIVFTLPIIALTMASYLFKGVSLRCSSFFYILIPKEKRIFKIVFCFGKCLLFSFFNFLKDKAANDLKHQARRKVKANMYSILDEYDDEIKDKPRNKKKIDNFVMVPYRLLTQGRYLTPEAKLVYTVLKSFENNKTKRIFPSYDKIQERSGLTRVAISKALRELKEYCWLDLKKNFGKSTDYVFTFPVLELNGLLLEDQTCPTKTEAKQWKEFLRKERSNKRNDNGYSKNQNVNNTKIVTTSCYNCGTGPCDCIPF
jgi:hypothetical protein